jgi:uncharacterized membrane protein
MVKKKSKLIDLFSVKTADRFSSFVGSWSFIGIYTAIMLTWVGLHLFKIIHIDNDAFTQLNLLLTYFAGTQASIILMSQTRQDRIDRRRQETNLEISKKLLQLFELNNKRMKHMMQNIDVLEKLVDDAMEDKDDQ